MISEKAIKAATANATVVKKPKTFCIRTTEVCILCLVSSVNVYSCLVLGLGLPGAIVREIKAEMAIAKRKQWEKRTMVERVSFWFMEMWPYAAPSILNGGDLVWW
jgi:hypothetical protein